MNKLPAPQERTTKVINGKLCIEQNGTKIWFRPADINRYIARLQAELDIWQQRRLMLIAGNITETHP